MNPERLHLQSTLMNANNDFKENVMKKVVTLKLRDTNEINAESTHLS